MIVGFIVYPKIRTKITLVVVAVWRAFHIGKEIGILTYHFIRKKTKSDPTIWKEN